jgi:kinesin family protein 3/17
MKLAAESQRFQELAPLLQPYGLDGTTDPKYIMSVLEKRREALLKDTVTVKEEKDRLLKKLEETQQRVKITETECTKLSDRIQWLESKVLNGGKSLLDHTNEQQKLIEMKQQELEESRLREQDIRLKLAEHELTANEIKGALVAHQTAVEVKLRKLQKLRFKLHTTREELEKSHKDNFRQRKHLIALQVDLRRELKLKRLIIDNFVPTVIRKLVENRIQHKEKDDGYYLAPVETTVMQTVKRPPMNKVLKLPLFHRSDSGTVHAFENVHYHDENILQLQLEMPKHLTTRYIPPRSNPYITSLMKRAFELAEQETVIDVGRQSHRKRYGQFSHNKKRYIHAFLLS